MQWFVVPALRAKALNVVLVRGVAFVVALWEAPARHQASAGELVGLRSRLSAVARSLPCLLVRGGVVLDVWLRRGVALGEWWSELIRGASCQMLSSGWVLLFSWNLLHIATYYLKCWLLMWRRRSQAVWCRSHYKCLSCVKMVVVVVLVVKVTCAVGGSVRCVQ